MLTEIIKYSEILFSVALFLTLFIYSILYFKYCKVKRRLSIIEKSVPTILIVEDDPINVELLSEILYEICHIEVVDSGEAAIEISKKRVFPVILMDINLGTGIDGIQTANTIKENEKYKNTYIIALTSYKPSDVVAEFSQSFSYFIQKPYDQQYIKELVRGLLMLN